MPVFTSMTEKMLNQMLSEYPFLPPGLIRLRARSFNISEGNI
jgi:hypothetical protein